LGLPVRLYHLYPYREFAVSVLCDAAKGLTSGQALPYFPKSPPGWPWSLQKPHGFNSASRNALLVRVHDWGVRRSAGAVARQLRFQMKWPARHLPGTATLIVEGHAK
jgi:hypothetical protein